jgi:hypothetical protein
VDAGGGAGQTTSFVSVRVAVSEAVDTRAFRALVRRQACLRRSLSAMLRRACRTSKVTDQLGLQVRKAAEVLIQALDRIDIDQQEAARWRRREVLHEAALHDAAGVLFSAEERAAPGRPDNRHYPVSTLREQLREVADRQARRFGARFAWSRLLATAGRSTAASRTRRCGFRPGGGDCSIPTAFRFSKAAACLDLAQ